MSKLHGLDVTVSQAAGQHIQTQSRGHDQQQQWLLMLEKAYLTLQQHNLEQHAAAAENSTDGERRDNEVSQRFAAPAPEPDDIPAPVPQAANAVAPTATGLSDTHLTIAADVGAGNVSTPKFNLSTDLPRLQSRPGITANSVNSAERLTSGLKPAVFAAIPELKSATLLKTQQGLHLVVRDLQVGDPKQFVERIRKLFAEVNLPLARITINGDSAWRQSELTELARVGDGGSMINKVY